MNTKTTFLSIAFSMAMLGANAQQDTIEYKGHTLYEQLDTSLLHTDFLIDRAIAAGPSFFNSDGILDGESPTPKAYETLDNLWFINEAAVALKPVPPIGEVMDSIRAGYSESEAYPILVGRFQYDRIKEYALDSNLLEISDTVLVEGDNTSESPYETGIYVGAGVLDSVLLGHSSFVLRPSFFYTNMPMPDSIQIDFGDGQGFRDIQFNQPISPSYGDYTADYDGKTANVKIRFKTTGSSGSTVHTTQYQMSFFFCKDDPSVPIPSKPPWTTGPPNWGQGTISAQTSVFGTGLAQGNAYVHYRKNPDAGEENLFHKPVIVVEGIDFGSHSSLIAQRCYRNGSFGWYQLWGSDQGDYPELGNMPQLLNDLHNQNYDIIMLDFKDGATDIRNNAHLLVELIQKINQYKTPDAEPNVVIGASMGGVVARYALAYMEQNNLNHCTRLYASFDAPHKGAYISLGAQYWLDFLANNRVEPASEAKDRLNQLARPAAKQLLKYNFWQSNRTNKWAYLPLSLRVLYRPIYLVDGESQEHVNFFNELNNLGYPQNLKKIAVANGSKLRADQGFQAGSKLYEMQAFGHVVVAVAGLEGEFWDLGGSTLCEGEIATVKFGFKKREATTYSNTLSNPPVIDRAPGGQRALVQEVKESMDEADLSIMTLNYNTALHSKQCFIPTISALDVNTTDYFYDVDDGIENETLPTPFDDVYAPNLNTLHVEITDGTITGRGDNIDYSKAKIYAGGGVSNTVLTGTYNYGEEFNNLVHHEEVKNGGLLFLYNNFADSQSGNTPPSGGQQDYRLGNGCTGQDLEISNNGELIIGEAAAGNRADFYISKDSKLTIANGGKLTIEDNSNLIIEEGAEFEFEDGATIELLNPDSKITFQGKITVDDNATFTFTGNGHLVFDQDIPWNGGDQPYDDFWDIGTNAEFTLVGSSGQTMLEAHREVHLAMEPGGNTFREVNLSLGDIKLAGTGFIQCFSPLNMSFVDIDALDPAQPHGGFRLHHGSGFSHYIQSNKMKNGSLGLAVFGYGASTPVVIGVCVFEDCTTGLKMERIGSSVFSCAFVNNSTGAYAYNPLGSSKISTSLFDQNGTGLRIFAATGGTYTSQGCTYSKNHNGAYLTELESFKATCNIFEDQTFAGIQVSNSIAYLNNTNSGNKFYNNQNGIYLTGSPSETGLFLNNGNNIFNLGNAGAGLSYNSQPTKTYIYGSFWQEPPLSTYNTNDEILADYNLMPLITYQTPPGELCCPTVLPVDIHILDFQGGVATKEQIQIDIPNNQANNTCDNITVDDPIGELGLLTESGSSGPPICCGAYQGDNLREALLDAADSISTDEEVFNDLFATYQLYEAVIHVNHDQTNDTKELQLRLGYELLMRAYGNAFKHGQLMHSENDEPTEDDTTAKVIEVIDDFVTQLDTSLVSYDALKFKFYLDRALVLRLGGFLDLAIADLNAMEYWADEDELQRIGYWKCVCTAEQTFWDNGGENVDQLQMELESCDIQFAGFNFKTLPSSNSELVFQKFSPSERVELVDVFPQPARSSFTVELNEPFAGQVKMELLTVDGALVQVQDLNWQGKRREVSAKNLASGIYILKLNFGGGRFLKEKITIE